MPGQATMQGQKRKAQQARQLGTLSQYKNELRMFAGHVLPLGEQNWRRKW